jgi:cellulose synthase/poly-beta-1,6-N-acetylglucosamine synthase-like glycosyltransferase
MLQKSDQMPDYIAIFDADSRPESDTLVLFLAAVRRNRSALLQMPSLYVCNTETLGAFADAVAQSIWTLAFEIPRWLRNEAHTRHIHYVVSHGLFIRVDVLKQYPIPLESNVEDILYGFTLYFHGIVPDVLPAYDVARGPNEMRHCILQKAKWFCGCVYATQAQFNIFRNQVILKPIMRRHLTSLWWLMGYFTILFVFVLMIMTSAITISMVLLIATCFYIFHYCLPAVITIDQLSHAALGSKMPNRIGLICYAISGGVLYYCLYNVGPWFGLLNAIRHLSFLRAANKIGQTQL